MSAISTANTQHSTISSRPNRQLRNSVSGSSTSSDTKLVRCSRKNDSHRPHSVLVPVTITFISRPEWVPV